MKRTICFSLLLYLTACTTQYKIKGDYIEPLTAEGSEKAKKCSEDKKKCALIFNQKKAICLLEKEKEARNNFPKLEAKFLEFQRIHKKEWEDYQSKLKSFEKEYRELLESFDEEPSCIGSCDDDDDEPMNSTSRAFARTEMNKKRPRKPIYAIPPNLSRHIKKLQQTCSDTYSCTKMYDSCFISSGGKIEYKNFFQY